MAIRDVPRRIPWTQQPQIAVGINWENPLTTKLQVAILPKLGDMVNGGGPPTIRGVPLFTPGPGGIAANTVYTGTGANDFLYPVKINAPGDRTLAIWGANVGSLGLCSVYAEDADSKDGLILNTTSFSSSLDNNVSNLITVTEAATPRLYAGRRTGNTQYASVDRVVSTSSVTGTRDLITTSLRIGRDTVGTNTVVAIAYLVLYWARYLSSDELAAISQNPWQLFAPLPRRIWAPVASGLPTLSASTYTPGSLSSGGWRPRITAT